MKDTIKIICVCFSIYAFNPCYSQTSDNSFELYDLKNNLKKIITQNSNCSFTNDFLSKNFTNTGRDYRLIDYINKRILNKIHTTKYSVIIYTTNGEIISHHAFFIDLENHKTYSLIIEYRQVKFSRNNLKIKSSNFEKYFTDYEFVCDDEPKLHSDSYMFFYKKEKGLTVKLLSDKDINKFLSN